MAFKPGWHPQFADAAKLRRTRASQTFAVFAATKPLSRPAYSLSQNRLRHLEQGQAGTCWLHAAVQLIETWAKARGLNAFAICRRLVGYQGKVLDGGGNPSDGGEPSAALEACTADVGRGVGIAHESLWPYTDDENQLALSNKPPAAVLADAKAVHVLKPFEVLDLDAAKALIDSEGIPTAIGIWWPYYWDNLGSTFFYQIGPGEFGHALTIIGYANAGVLDDHEWIQLDNWHGLLYAPLVAALAAKIPGYQPISDKATSDFWVRRDVLETVMSYSRGTSLNSATDLAGYARLFDPADALNPGQA